MPPDGAMTAKEQLKEDIQDVMDDLIPLLDELVELCNKDNWLKRFVPGNLWASRYGYTGEGVLDLVEKWIRE
jgi:hypothetical protein